MQKGIELRKFNARLSFSCDWMLHRCILIIEYSVLHSTVGNYPERVELTIVSISVAK